MQRAEGFMSRERIPSESVSVKYAAQPSSLMGIPFPFCTVSCLTQNKKTIQVTMHSSLLPEKVYSGRSPAIGSKFVSRSGVFSSVRYIVESRSP